MELHNISFLLQILNTNIASLNELQYNTSTELLSFQGKQLHEDSKVEHETGTHLQRRHTYTREGIKIKTTAQVALGKGASNIEVINRLKTKTTIWGTANTTNIVLTKIIVFYTPYIDEKPWGHFSLIKDYNKTCGCSFDGCEISGNNNDYSRADIVFLSCEEYAKFISIEEFEKESQKESILDVFCERKSILCSPSWTSKSSFWISFAPPVGHLNHRLQWLTGIILILFLHMVVMSSVLRMKKRIILYMLVKLKVNKLLGW